MYYNGQGVDGNCQQALCWFFKAADQGNSEAQYHLGVMYAEGQGVDQNHVQAHKWFNLAASKGSERAAKARGAMAEKMTPDQIAEAKRLATQFHLRSN